MDSSSMLGCYWLFLNFTLYDSFIIMEHPNISMWFISTLLSVCRLSFLQEFLLVSFVCLESYIDPKLIPDSFLWGFKDVFLCHDSFPLYNRFSWNNIDYWVNIFYALNLFHDSPNTTCFEGYTLSLTGLDNRVLGHRKSWLW